MGYLAFYSPLSSERDGERLYEITLQIIRHYCSQINPLSLKTVFVTYRESVSYKEACKRASFTTQKGVDWKVRGK